MAEKNRLKTVEYLHPIPYSKLSGLSAKTEAIPKCGNAAKSACRYGA
jgi:hypothetical protein